MQCHVHCGVQHLNKLLIHVLCIMAVITTILEHVFNVGNTDYITPAVFSVIVAAALDPLASRCYYTFKIEDRRAAASAKMGSLNTAIDCFRVGNSDPKFQGLSEHTLTQLDGLIHPTNVDEFGFDEDALDDGMNNAESVFAANSHNLPEDSTEHSDEAESHEHQHNSTSSASTSAASANGVAPMKNEQQFDAATCGVVKSRKYEIQGHVTTAVISVSLAFLVYVNSAYWCVERISPFYDALFLAIVVDIILVQPISRSAG